MSDRWWRYRRHAANGRVEVACRATDDHLYWLTTRELVSWTVCPHCVGWVSHWPTVERRDHGRPARRARSGTR